MRRLALVGALVVVAMAMGASVAWGYTITPLCAVGGGAAPTVHWRLVHIASDGDVDVVAGDLRVAARRPLPTRTRARRCPVRSRRARPCRP